MLASTEFSKSVVASPTSGRMVDRSSSTLGFRRAVCPPPPPPPSLTHHTLFCRDVSWIKRDCEQSVKEGLYQLLLRQRNALLEDTTQLSTNLEQRRKGRAAVWLQRANQPDAP